MEDNLIYTKWLNYANEDIRTAKAIIKEDLPARNACYMAQQCAEKSLKALLLKFKIPFKKSHDLAYLAELLPREYANTFLEFDLEWLTEWCVEGRYPGDYPEADREDAMLAINIAEAVYHLAYKILTEQKIIIS
ncbi:HEPN domain-containing protein [Carboxydocella sporoproducens DSM 16521]|uniref:HEPN domain-containing protein n=2 Tax=Carboxydocella TaxID=178898 RepID=A0A1T4L5V6_9FIRM|nr:MULTISPECIES: HEPN domain-containing protein [Carboxydocella]AVX19949.1 HEPN domain-containing protein [Carboxydocella thermautotrophica]AVX30371.1 HEPN domain-containing protein [Carboxydocella thermautotrophica]SJZ50126.1 HEPN domain-containing protein [Carboxydocella sporoproducens DSM 16521]